MSGNGPFKHNGKWVVDVRPWGSTGKRWRRVFDSKADANYFHKYALGLAAEGKEWTPQEPEKDDRLLAELIEAWYTFSGHNLKDAERRKNKLLVIAKELGSPVARKLTAKRFLIYRNKRLKSGTSQKTLNNELGYLSAVYNYLIKINEIDYKNPLVDIDAYKIDEIELSYLTIEEITHLLETIKAFNLNPHVELISKISLATGSRWGETEAISSRQLHNNKITFINTKSGKTRAVPISAELFKKVSSHLKEHGGFTPSLGAFRRALKKSEIILPKGQAAHVLRHTFASHYIMNGGNIVTLQKILGHSTINMTMRYAHLAPDHLQDAVDLNPLNGI